MTTLMDAAVLYCGLFLSVRVAGLDWSQRYVTLSLLGILLHGILAPSHQLYQPWRVRPLLAELPEVAVPLGAAFGLMWLLLRCVTDWASEPAQIGLLAGWYAVTVAGLMLVRAGMRWFLAVFRVGPTRSRRVAFLGTTRTALELAAIFRAHSWMGADVAGFYQIENQAGAGLSPHFCQNAGETDGDLQDLVDQARRGEIAAVYISLRQGSAARLSQIVDAFADTTVSIYHCPEIPDIELLNAHVDDILGRPVISIVSSPFDGTGRYLKQFEDLVLVTIILPLITPLMLLIALAVKLSSQGPVFYLQSRHGFDGRPFKIVKFRTMYTTDADHEFVQARSNDPRITWVGRFLRRTSLDELPQFLNVLVGDMSVVGPRPAPVKYNEAHREIIYRYMARHKAKPGITGLAQVSGARGETDVLAKTEERTRLDLKYINEWSLRLDLVILWRTVLLIARELRVQ